MPSSYNNFLKSWIFWFVLCLPCVSLASTDFVLVNRPESEKDKRYEYNEKLLSMILAKTNQQFGVAEVKQSEVTMSRDRIFQEMIKGELIHVVGEAVKPEWEKQLLPVYIPMRKGIQGFRLFLIHQKNQALLSKIQSLEELKQIPTGTHTQWSTTRVLKEHGFVVAEAIDYENLFTMLQKDRFVTFNRGINEIFAELESHQQELPELTIEDSLLLYFPLPTYFFITPTRPQLADRIRIGFQQIIAEGSFETFFQSAFGELIKKARLKERRMFSISNPNLSDKNPLDNPMYWYKP